MQYCSTNLSKISFKFTDKEPFFADLSVSKTHFTDKPAFSNDLSVNFWPLWWGFTDRIHFLEHLSVKPGPKRLNFYGQSAIFDHFVRNRHFSNRPITDKASIFIDVSVNGSDIAKCSADWQRTSFGLFDTWKRSRLFRDISIMESDCHAYAKNRIELQLIANHPVFQFEA